MSADANAIPPGVRTGSALARLVIAVLQRWPEHEAYLAKSFGVRDARTLEHSHDLGEMVERVARGEIDAFCAGYRWQCDMVREEELNFRRAGRYRCSSFLEALDTVYSDEAVMNRYMKGQLFSEVFWSNHASIMSFYIDAFLARLPRGGTLLEVGPGHGMLLALAAKHAECRELTGWDVSAVSLRHTEECLALLGVATPARLVAHNVFDDPPVVQHFDGVVISEVCEHLERPVAALEALKRVMVPGGRIFVNVPVNAPSIDHIYLLKTPEEAVDMVRQAGFEIEATRFAPAAGYPEDEARRRKLAISVGVVGRAV